MKKLILIRHAPAEDQDDSEDAERPLTHRGVKKMRRLARGIARIQKEMDLLVSSPLLRAIQTSDILDGPLKIKRVILSSKLEPLVSPDELGEWLSTIKEDSVILVGHEPQLSHFSSWLIGVFDYEIFRFKKGGVAMFEIDGSLEKGKARLKFLLQPALLKKIS